MRYRRLPLPREANHDDTRLVDEQLTDGIGLNLEPFGDLGHGQALLIELDLRFQHARPNPAEWHARGNVYATLAAIFLMAAALVVFGIGGRKERELALDLRRSGWVKSRREHLEGRVREPWHVDGFERFSTTSFD